MAHIIVGTAGHIDHGKTALVKAMTGIDADRLKEEKQRGITIDIGFANLSCEDGTAIGFVDVPGHERFIKNMLAGTGGIDLVMLVIAADEGVMPQTREHLDICSLLRVQNGVAVITKIDKVDQDLAEIREQEIRDFLRGSFLETSPILRTSSANGAGIAKTIAAVQKAARDIQQKDDTRIFRLPVDRCFTVKGFGTVVTGTVVAGTIAREQEVEVLPSGKRARIRGIEVYGNRVDHARAGQRAAINLHAVEVGDIRRGMVVTEPGLFASTSMLDCHVELLSSAPGPIEDRKRIRFHIGTAEVMGYVTPLGGRKIEPGCSAFAQVRLDEPIFALPGDRFIIRQYSPMITIGGGRILDAYPQKHRRRLEDIAVRKLMVLKDGSVDDRIMTVVEEADLFGIDVQTLVQRLGLPPAVLREKLTELQGSKRVRILSDNPITVVSATVFTTALSTLQEQIRRFHVSNPLASGISREELKRVSLRNAAGAVFQAALTELVIGNKVVVVNDAISEFGRKAELAPEERIISDQLIERFRKSGLNVPPPDELIDQMKLDPGSAKRVIQWMVKSNLCVRVADDIIVDRRTMDELIKGVRELKKKSPNLGVLDFKNLTGVSRKYAIPILEYLDRQRVTRRIGNDRLIL